MPAAWQPLYVTEVRAAMATIGFGPVGSATLSENFDWMVLEPAARARLAAIADDDARELVRDFYLDQRLRCDVFARGNRRLSVEERDAHLSASAFALGRPLPAIRYTMSTPKGHLNYDGPSARAVIARLAAGKPPSGDLNTVLTLAAAGDIVPVEPGRAFVGDLNRIFCERVDGPEEIGWLALPCGTAIAVEPGLLRALRDGAAIDDDRLPGWRGFLAAHGL
jgi:hypothetical protein